MWLTISTSDVSISMTGEDVITVGTAVQYLCSCVCSVESVSYSKLSKSSCTSIGLCSLLLSVCYINCRNAC